MNEIKVEKFLKDLLKELKESQKHWCAESVDDAEEMWEEYPQFIEATIPKIINLLEEK